MTSVPALRPLCLQPPHATDLERRLSLSTDVLSRLGKGLRFLPGWKTRSPHKPAHIPWLILEYGLGPISSYFDDLEKLLGQGPRWQRRRGTPDAVDRALSWIGFKGWLEEAPLRRKRWNLNQLALEQLPWHETPVLDQISFLTKISLCERSKFYRGFFGYDARACEPGWNALGNSCHGADSGVRLSGNATLWSFGRTHETRCTVSQSVLQGLGLLITPRNQPFRWLYAKFPWRLANFSWDATVDSVRLPLMAAGLAQLSCWFEFRTGDKVIGYRKARIFKQVTATADGPYPFAEISYQHDPLSPLLYAQALTDFNQATGAEVSAVNLVFGGQLNQGVKPGVQWAAPEQMSLSGAARQPLSIAPFTFEQTRRERLTILLDLPSRYYIV